MISENEDYFKKNITDALAVKLNDCIFAVRQDVSNRLFEHTESTPETAEIVEFVSFVNSFQPGKFKFKDDSIINITENEVKGLTVLFESLNAANKLKMAQDIFNTSNTFKQHVDFAQRIKGLQ